MLRPFLSPTGVLEAPLAPPDHSWPLDKAGAQKKTHIKPTWSPGSQAAEWQGDESGNGCADCGLQSLAFPHILPCFRLQPAVSASFQKRWVSLCAASPPASRTHHWPSHKRRCAEGAREWPGLLRTPSAVC